MKSVWISLQEDPPGSRTRQGKYVKTGVAWLHISCNVIIEVDYIIKKVAATHSQPSLDLVGVWIGEKVGVLKCFIDFNTFD